MGSLQGPWFSCFKTIRNKKKLCWVVAYSLVTHLLCLKIIGNIPQGVWKLSHRFIVHFLRLKMLWDLSYLTWNTFIRNKHICLCPWGWAREESNFMDRKNDSRPLNQRFSIVRASLIFVCISQRPTFFSGIFTAYLYMIFVCVKLSR